MNEREMIIAILNRIGAEYHILDDNTLDICGIGYDRGISIEFDADNKIIEII